MDIRGDNYISWMYPQIYKDEKKSRLTISLSHVRAANDINIEYDGERDGWAILQEQIIEHGSHSEGTGKFIEVAFVPAWGTEIIEVEDANGK